MKEREVAEPAIRLARLREAMGQKGIDLFYVRNVINIQWLTGFDEVFDSEDAHCLIVSQQSVLLHTDSRYGEAAKRQAENSPVEVSALQKSHAQMLIEFIETQDSLWKDSCHIGIESSVSLGEFRRLEADIQAAGVRADFKETQGVILGLRAVKDATEISRLKKAQAITDAAFSHIVSFIRPKMTEREVQIELEDFMVRRGADGLAFSSIVASGANGALPHAIPGKSILSAGQAVVLDFGARHQSYCSDMTRTVFLGDPIPEVCQAYEVLKEANEAVEAFLRPGITGAQAQELAESILDQGGFGGSMGHSLGHGVGLEIHESPALSARNTEALQEGNVITVEPGIYRANEFGMRLEDFGVVVNSGFEVFTQSSHDMVII